MKIILSSEDTSGHVSIVDQTFIRNDWVLEHMHKNEGHLIEVKKGKFIFNIEGVEDILDEGKILLIKKNVFHSFVGLKKRNILRITIFPAGLESLMKILDEDQLSAEEVESLYKKFGICFR